MFDRQRCDWKTYDVMQLAGFFRIQRNHKDFRIRVALSDIVNDRFLYGCITEVAPAVWGYEYNFQRSSIQMILCNVNYIGLILLRHFTLIRHFAEVFVKKNNYAFKKK